MNELEELERRIRDKILMPKIKMRIEVYRSLLSKQTDALTARQYTNYIERENGEIEALNDVLRMISTIKEERK